MKKIIKHLLGTLIALATLICCFACGGKSEAFTALQEHVQQEGKSLLLGEVVLKADSNLEFCYSEDDPEELIISYNASDMEFRLYLVGYSTQESLWNFDNGTTTYYGYLIPEEYTPATGLELDKSGGQSASAETLQSANAMLQMLLNSVDSYMEKVGLGYSINDLGFSEYKPN